MKELTSLLIQNGSLSQEFLDLANKEAIVGASNAIPLLLEVLLGSFRPKLGKERQI